MLLLFFVTVNNKHPAVSSVVPRGLVCDKRSAPNVSGAVSRSRIKIVAEGKIVPSRQGENDCFARRIGQAERLTDRLTRQSEGTDTSGVGDGRRSRQIEAGILRKRNHNTWSRRAAGSKSN